MPAAFSQKIIDTIKKIPKGKVATYGQIAAMAGNPQAARQVVRILIELRFQRELCCRRCSDRSFTEFVIRWLSYEQA